MGVVNTLEDRLDSRKWRTRNVGKGKLIPGRFKPSIRRGKGTTQVVKAGIWKLWSEAVLPCFQWLPVISVFSVESRAGQTAGWAVHGPGCASLDLQLYGYHLTKVSLTSLAL